MVQEGCLDGIDEVYGFHNVPNFDEGDIRVVSGGMLAASTTVEIEIQGQGGHGSAPHKCVKDPITTACNMLNAFHSIKARNIDSRDNVVFSICAIDSGSTFNVFPDTAFLKGTIRSYREEPKEKMIQRVKEIARDVSAAFDCTAAVKIWDKYPAVINHEE